MATETKATVNIEVSCDARKVLAGMASDMKQKQVGTIIGHAVDFIERANAAGGPPVQGFAGSFEINSILPVDEGGNDTTTTSGNLFLPDAFRGPLDKVLRGVLYPDPKKPQKKARGAVSFAANLFLVRSSNSIGYDWAMQAVQEPRVVDALGDLRKLVTTAAKPAKK
jgi:hypothetical protein